MKRAKFLTLSMVLLSCFICACVPSTAVNNAANADTNKTAETANVFEPFYVYEDFMSPKNHYAPSGWMGDVANLELDQSYSQQLGR